MRDRARAADAACGPGAGPPLRVAVAAGGTAGHLMPALATAEALSRRRPCAFLFLASRRPVERRLRPLIPYPVAEIGVEGLAGVPWGRRPGRLLRLPLALAEAWRHLGRFRADLLIVTGGYVSGPAAAAGWLRRVPVLALEQNASPGLAIRWLRPLARAIAVAHPEAAARLGPKAVVAGNPVRRSLPAAPERDGVPRPAAPAGGLRLLILGGSQGARGLNAMVEAALPRLATADLGLRIHHQTGPDDLEGLRRAYQRHGIPATVSPFIADMAASYAWADLVCARAGATTCAELTYCGKPAILVPFPAAAGRHQHDNAAVLARAGAARVVEEEAGGGALATAIIQVARDPARLAAMAACAAALGQDDAADRVAELALSLVRRHAPRRAGAREALGPAGRS